MRSELIWALCAFIGRILLGSFFVVAERSSREASIIILADVPTLVTSFTLNRIIGWPEGFVGSEDISFSLLGLLTWTLLGFVIGVCTNRGRARAAR